METHRAPLDAVSADVCPFLEGRLQVLLINPLVLSPCWVEAIPQGQARWGSELSPPEALLFCEPAIGQF